MDFDCLSNGLSRLSLHESRHAMRFLLANQGGNQVGPYNTDIAETALAKLDPPQRDALSSYCGSFLPTHTALAVAQ